MRTLILLFLLNSFYSVYGQINFFNLYTDNGDDFGEGIVQLEDSSFVITGSSSSFGWGSTDAFLLKIDSLGNYLWSKNYGGPESDGGRRVMYNPGDGFYVAGTTNSYGNGAYDFYLFKTDLSGNLIWERTYGGSGWERMNDAVLTNDGGIIMVGETSSNSTQDRNSTLYKLNLNGDTLYTLHSQIIGTDYISSITHYQDTLVSISGNCYLPDSSKWIGFVSTYHVNGGLIWGDTISINGDCFINDIVYSNDMLYSVGSRNTLDNSSYGRLRIKHDLFGSVVSINTITSSVHYSDKDICEYGNTGDFIISFEYEDPSIPGNATDLAIWKYSFPFTNQNQWTPVPFLNNDVIGQTIKTNDNSVVSVGSTSGYNQSFNNVFVSKIGPGSVFPNATAPHNTQQLVALTEDFYILIKLYPNPVSNILNVSGDFDQLESLVITDLKCKLVLSSNSKKIDVSELTQGVYITTIRTNKGTARKRLVIQ